MPFSDFIGSAEAVRRLRALIAARDTSRTLILSGATGSGKTTLAAMAGLALNCERPPQPADFCGVCASCRSFRGFGEIDASVEEARSFRDEQVKSRTREEAPLVISVHPQIRIFPRDGDFLSIHQARELIRLTQLHPDEGRHWALILPDFDSARWLVQTALLKTLEEPPERVIIFALVRNPLELLPTVRSRAQVIALPGADEQEIDKLLNTRRSELKPADRQLLARVAQGSPGAALTLDLTAYRELREQATVLLRSAVQGGRQGHQALFETTETWRSDKERFESLVEILYSVVQDILHLTSENADAIRNVDRRAELSSLARDLSFDQLARAVEGLDSVLASSRRNANRPLALDAWALRLSQVAGGR